jgi:hypothetical protein
VIGGRFARPSCVCRFFELSFYGFAFLELGRSFGLLLFCGFWFWCLRFVS